MNFVTKMGDDMTLEPPTIPPTSIRPASPLLPPTTSLEEDEHSLIVPPSLPKIIKPSLVSAFGFSIKDVTEIGDPFTSQRRTMKKTDEETRSEKQNHKLNNSSELLILTPKQLPPPVPENVPIETIPSAHGTFTGPADRVPESFMKQLESLRESAKLRESAQQRQKVEEIREQQQFEQKKKLESKSAPIVSSSPEKRNEHPYYEGLGLSSSIFSSPEKHDMEIAMYVVFERITYITYITHTFLPLSLIPLESYDDTTRM